LSVVRDRPGHWWWSTRYDGTIYDFDRRANLKSSMDSTEFLIQFLDYLAPTLDTYEQAIYLYVVRHSRLVELDEVALGFKSVRAKLAFGIGEKGKPMSEASLYSRLRSLEQKGCLERVDTVHGGTLVRAKLPSEMPGLIPSVSQPGQTPTIEEMDFFSDSNNRLLILKRENYKCFYTLKRLTKDNFVIDHVVSRPNGNSSYRNVVAASRQANNMKGSSSAEEFLRRLYRENFLSEEEFQGQMHKLNQLALGELKPDLSE
jgi:hypothetical protein